MDDNCSTLRPRQQERRGRCDRAAGRQLPLSDARPPRQEPEEGGDEVAGLEVNLDRTLLPRKRIPVREVIVHEDYRTDGQTDDIALLKLSECLSLYILHTSRQSGIQ